MIKNEISQIRNALTELTELNNADHWIISEANSLIEYIEKFDFLAVLRIWQNVLLKINLVCKSMQSSKIDIGTIVLLLDNCTQFLQDYRTTGYTEALQSTEKLSLQEIKCWTKIWNHSCKPSKTTIWFWI